MLKKTLLVALAVSLASLAPAAAISIVYTGLFSAEVSGGTGSGDAVVTIDTDLLTMNVQAVFSGLSGLVTASHIHCCTTLPGTGNAGVATITPSFTSFPTGVSAGSYNFDYDMSLAGSYNPAFVTANGGTAATAFNALVLGLDQQRAYFNIHTNTFPGGEIRAILTPVPEPATAGLVLLGLGLLGHSARKRTLSA